MAYIQKHGGIPASSRHVVVATSTNWLVLSASELCFVFPANEVSIGILRIFIALSNCGASSEYASRILRRAHELFDRTYYRISVLSGRWVRLKHPRISIPDDKDGFVVAIVLFSNTTIVNIVERDQVPKLRELALKGSSERFPVFHLGTRWQDSQYGFL